MLFRILFSLALLTISSSALAQQLDLRLGQDMARATYTTLYSSETNFGTTEISGGFMYNNDGNTVFDVGLQVVDMAGTGTPGLEIGLGPRAYYLSLDTPNASGLSLALGANFHYKSADLERVNFFGSIYFAPEITSFMDSDGMVEYSFGVGYDVLQDAEVYIGYQNINMDINNAGGGNHDLDDGVMIGVRMNF